MNYLDRRGVIFFLIIDAVLVVLALSAPLLRRAPDAPPRAIDDVPPGIDLRSGFTP